MQPIRSAPYTVRRIELTLITAELYVRYFWWMLIGLPIGGFLTLLFLPQPIMKYLGAVMLLWPISIPARATVLTSDQRKLYGKPTIATYHEEAFYLDPEDGVPTRVPLTWARNVVKRGQFYVINRAGSMMHGKGFSFVLIKSTAFSPEQQTEIESSLNALGKLR